MFKKCSCNRELKIIGDYKNKNTTEKRSVRLVYSRVKEAESVEIGDDLTTHGLPHVMDSVVSSQHHRVMSRFWMEKFFGQMIYRLWH